MRLGVLGGTFNPIHYGHLNSAAEIAHLFHLDKVLFIPTYITPHKDILEQNPYYRLEMTRLAVQTNHRFIVSPVEIERGGKSYTLDTIKELKRTYSEDSEFFFIFGLDAFQEIESWKKSNLIFSECNLIVNIRRKSNLPRVKEILHRYTQRNKELKLDNEERDQISKCPKIPILNTPYAVFIVSTTFMDISSSRIRERVVKGEVIKYLLPDKVEEYIIKNQIYLANE